MRVGNEINNCESLDKLLFYKNFILQYSNNNMYNYYV